jgi:hypothetical protein
MGFAGMPQYKQGLLDKPTTGFRMPKDFLRFHPTEFSLDPTGCLRTSVEIRVIFNPTTAFFPPNSIHEKSLGIFVGLLFNRSAIADR